MDLFLFFQIVLVSIAATSVMTLSSYIISTSLKELYKEPVLLALVFTNMNLKIPVKSKHFLGWIAHYSIGFFFVLSYHFIWTNHILEIAVLDTLLLGAVSGIIGIVSWMLLFLVTNYYPDIEYKGYYLQLFLVHIIFAIIATLTYHISHCLSLLSNAYITL
jgi:hypothetical protein